MSKRNRIIVVTGILAVMIGFGSIFLYINIKENNELEAFNDYMEVYKVEMSNYTIAQHKDKYDDLVSKSEQVVSNKEVKNIDNIKQESIVLKDEIVKANLELVNGLIAEIEEVDISKVDDKESIEAKIDEIKVLRDDSKFITANEVAVGLKDKINKKLEDIRVEEEKKKADEEAKRLEEEKRKAEDEANRVKVDNIQNSSGVFLQENAIKSIVNFFKESNYRMGENENTWYTLSENGEDNMKIVLIKDFLEGEDIYYADMYNCYMIQGGGEGYALSVIVDRAGNVEETSRYRR